MRGTVEVRAIATPDHPDYVVRFERSVNGGPFTTVSTDDSSPVYTAFDNTSSLPDQASVTYRAVLTYAPGRTVTSDTRTVTVVQTPVTTAIVHYNRPGRRLRRRCRMAGACTSGVTRSTRPSSPPWRGTGRSSAPARTRSARCTRSRSVDDTKPVNFIMHLPNGDSVPTTREPGGDRSFVPLDHPQIWLRQGDPTVYFSPPPP